MTSLNHSEKYMKQFYIPSYILVPDSEEECSPDIVPECPLLVFINSRSGGQLGGDLFITYRSILNKAQVFDVGEESPDSVLHRVYLNLEKLKNNGDEFARELEKKLKIIVAGEDGTAGWLLGVVSDMKLSQPPPIATVPLGTGNNLPFAFGWGKKNPGTDRNSVLSFMEQVRKAKEMKIDSWHILMQTRAPKEGSYDPIAPLELPHSLHAFNQCSSTDDLNVEGCDTFRGGFWNYFSMGMDAQVSYAFNSERKLHPEKFRNQQINQGTYAKLVSSQGWFLASLFHPSSRNIAYLCKVKIMKRHGDWQELSIPKGIRSIVCLNLPSFSGGLNPWGTPNINDRRDAHRIRFEFHKGAESETYMSIDGEPWKQPLPVNDETVVVEISHHGQVKMLAAHDCRSKSVFDPSTPITQEADERDSDNEDNSVGAEWRKFGAADTFKIPDAVDISSLS
ncbi:hypothetical protein ACJIZ3_023269 [Penstemon smallii]|uniref:Diacylglycerol kinase n=1 Tax=Penstemon smallii TaxID=265156 RepID=A0ABD3TR15_9LAMI